MPYIPPDPGRVAAILDGFRVQLRELEQLLAERHDPLLSVAVVHVRSTVELLQKLLQKAEQKTPKG